MTLSELLDRLELKIAASREERLMLIESIQRAQSQERNRPKSPKRNRTNTKQLVPQTVSVTEKVPSRKRLALGKSLVQLRSRSQSSVNQVSQIPETPNEPDEPAPSRLLALSQHA